MYKILGADQKVYGPVPPEMVRQWILEGRANASTSVQREDSTEWQPLSTFPEFAALLPASAPPLVDDRKSRLAAGLLGILLGGLGIHRFYLGYTWIGIIQIIVTVASCGWGYIWGLVEGILILTRSSITTDADGKPLRD